MGAYTAKLRDRREIATGTLAFYFDKPGGFDFVGGQYIDLTLIDPPETDAKGSTRAFSLAMAPHEPFLMVATRLRDTAFKRALRTMPLGTEVKVEGPFGSMTLHRKTARPAVILAGGIGITPFRSMLRQAANANTGHHLLLFYSNRRLEDAAFLTELLELGRLHPNFTIIPTMTDTQKCGGEWNGERGYINREMLLKFAVDWTQSVYYTAGPPGLVSAMKKMLEEAGVDEESVNSEDFSGY